jgi:hypothetical protein
VNGHCALSINLPETCPTAELCTEECSAPESRPPDISARELSAFGPRPGPSSDQIDHLRASRPRKADRFGFAPS